jgi:hypothetical protein
MNPFLRDLLQCKHSVAFTTDVRKLEHSSDWKAGGEGPPVDCLCDACVMPSSSCPWNASKNNSRHTAEQFGKS